MLINDCTGSSLQSHLCFEPRSDLSLGSKLSFSRDSPNFLYHGFPRRAVESSGINLALKGEGKNAFPFFRHRLPLAFVLSANNPHDRLSHLFYSSRAVFFGLQWAKTLLYFFCSSNQRASEQATIGVLSHFSGAGALWTSQFLLSSRGIGKHFVQSPLHEHWDPGVSRLALLLLFDSMACCCFLLSFLFLSLLFLLLGRLRMMNGNWMDDRNYLNYQYLNICYHSLFHSCELSCL